METKEWHTKDKSEWPDGPWKNEPDKMQWRDEETGLPCLIVRNNGGALCGYVGVSKDHPYFEKDYDDCDIECHGGLTFADHCHEGGSICHIVEPGEDDKVWWLGFDCGHGGDVHPAWKDFPTWGEETYKNIDYVKREIKSITEQLIKRSKC